MSLISIISQLQSIQPYRRNASAESIAVDLTKTKNSLIRLARLLQNSGTSRGNRYTPDESNSSKQSKAIVKDLRKINSEVDRLSGEQKRFKGYVQQTIRDVEKQLQSLQQITKRNQNLLRSVQSEIGMGRPQKIMNYAFGSSASQVPSYGRNIKAQLNRLSQQIAVINSNQQRMIQDDERNADRKTARGDLGIVGRGKSALQFKQKTDYLTRMQATSLAQTQLPGFAEEGTKEGDLQRKGFAGAMFIFLSATAEGKVFLGKMNKLLGKAEEDASWIDEVDKVKGGTPYMIDKELLLKQGSGDPEKVKALNKQLAELVKTLNEEKDDTKKKELEKQIQEIKNQKLKELKDAGIITQEHVAAKLATAAEVTHYKYQKSPTAALEYVEKSVVAQYPEIWDVDSNTGMAKIKDNWKETISKTPEKVSTKIDTTSKDTRSSAQKPNISDAQAFDPEFMKKVISVADKWDIEPADLLAVMYRESRLDPAIKNPDSTASGLIQFTEDTAKSLGTTTAELRKMSRTQQMDYVDKYFEFWKLPKGADRGTIYSYIYLPGRAQKGGAYLSKKGEEFYDLNKGLDKNKDDYITVEDLHEETKGLDIAALALLEKEKKTAVAANLTTPETTASKKETAAMADDVASIVVERVENDSEEEKDLVAKQNEIKDQQVSDEIQSARIAATAADLKVNKIAQMVVKTAKEVNGIREIVRLTTGVTDFSVKDPNISNNWNV
jgi:hypothetical protein